jgi:hypothetical protein
MIFQEFVIFGHDLPPRRPWWRKTRFLEKLISRLKVMVRFVKVSYKTYAMNSIKLAHNFSDVMDLNTILQWAEIKHSTTRNYQIENGHHVILTAYIVDLI